MPIAVSVVPLSEVAWTNTWPRGREPDLDPVLGGGAGAPGDRVHVLVAADRELVGGDAKLRSMSWAETVVSTALRVLPAAGTLIVPVGACDVVVGGRAQQGVAATGGGAVPVVDHGPAELVLGIDRGPGRLGDRPGEACRCR